MHTSTKKPNRSKWAQSKNENNCRGGITLMVICQMAGDEASRRRLPSWMKKPDDGDKTNNPAPKNKISSQTKKKPTTISTQPLTTINKRKVSKSNKLVPRDDGEGELSVEDLLSIAKEVFFLKFFFYLVVLVYEELFG